jgi:hypothetical protein
MACSCYLEKQRNIQQEDLDYSTQGFSLKQLFRSGKSRRRKKKIEDNNLYQENVMKQEVRNTQLFKEHFRNESAKTSSQTSNIFNLLKIHNSYSNHLSHPFEVVLSVNMSSNLQGETIPMAYPAFLENYGIISRYTQFIQYRSGNQNIQLKKRSLNKEVNLIGWRKTSRGNYSKERTRFLLKRKKVSINCLCCC